MRDRPKVSVLIITYNHESFIADALESALAQETDFEYEIVVGDDHSTDRTWEIVTRYADRHPDVLRAVRNDVNIGPHPNFTRSRGRTRGEYLALLDGDDYWTSPHKLQRQVDQLDRRADQTLVFHPVEVLDGRRRTWYPPGRRSEYDLGDLMKGNFIATGSVVCRNRPEVEYPRWYDQSRVMPGDWAFFCLNARHGDIGYIDTPMSVYRRHDSGVWAGSPPHDRVRRLRASIELCRRLNEDFDHEYDASVRRAVAEMRLKIFVLRTVPFLVRPLMWLRDLAGRMRS